MASPGLGQRILAKWQETHPNLLARNVPIGIAPIIIIIAAAAVVVHRNSQ